MDTGGLEGPPFQRVWTLMDPHGRRVEIYGSGGWGFESLRACCMNPLRRRGSFGLELADLLTLGNHPVSLRPRLERATSRSSQRVL